MRLCAVLLIVVVILVLQGCGGAASPSTAAPAPTTALTASPQSVTVSGSYNAETPNVAVLVNGLNATLNAGTWTYTVPVTTNYQTLKVELYVNNVLTDYHEVEVDTTIVQ